MKWRRDVALIVAGFLVGVILTGHFAIRRTLDFPTSRSTKRMQGQLDWINLGGGARVKRSELLKNPPGIEHMAWYGEQHAAVALRACDSGVPLGEDEQCSHITKAGQVMLVQCTIVPGHVVANRISPSPHRLCLSGNVSWGCVCSWYVPVRGELRRRIGDVLAHGP